MLKEKEEIRDAYSAAETAEQYIDKRFASAWGSVLHETQVRVVNEVVRTYGVKRLLEIAPGPARLSREVVGFEQGYLCEANEAMLQVARRRLAHSSAGVNGNGRWCCVQGDAFRLPFAGPFDMVYSFRFIRHFEQNDRTALYDQIRSLLKDGGLFVFDAVNEVISRPRQIKAGPDHHFIYDVLYGCHELRRELRAHGFNVLELRDVIRHMTLQQWLQVFVGPRSHRLAKRLIQLLEYVPGEPLEWVVVCRKC